MRLKSLTTVGITAALTITITLTGTVNIMGGASTSGTITQTKTTTCSNTSGSSGMDKAIEEAWNMANNDTIGYSQATRRLNPNVDCSSFVFYALQKAGYDVGDNPFNTIGMNTILPNLGFTKTEWDGNVDTLKKGDIMWASGHTEIYLGDGRTIGAHTDYDGKDGDGDGNEVSAVPINTSAFTAYWRPTTTTTTTAVSDSNPDISYLDTWTYADAEAHDPGGNNGKCTYLTDQCTQWACIRSHMFGHKEIHNIMGNGMSWVDSAVALGWNRGVIAPGSIMAWAPGAQVQTYSGMWGADTTYGHVSIVESVDTTTKTLQFSESGTGQGHIRTVKMSYENIPATLTFAAPPGITTLTGGTASTGAATSTTTSCSTNTNDTTNVTYTGDGTHASPDEAKQIARQLLSQYFPDNHGDDQWDALEKLWTRESSWQWNAENPGSGAYGIPQSLPADKMASAGNDWKDNAATQIKWGLTYIKNRYGTPKNAWNHSETVGWY